MAAASMRTELMKRRLFSWAAFLSWSMACSMAPDMTLKFSASSPISLLAFTSTRCW
jgi:hypothetical protein